ncbi:MAG: prepilin-type N-terminal cleavage/methylation domain-containing protein [Lachnospiraceae bacterium]|nr:prepilin-type N-terminal cleavage/methylation domain-containing protein [Lachnospiraceae bacterium]
MKKILTSLRNDSRGVTLVELMVVMALMAILIGVVAIFSQPYLERARLESDTEILTNMHTQFCAEVSDIGIDEARERLNNILGYYQGRVQYNNADSDGYYGEVMCFLQINQDRVAKGQATCTGNSPYGNGAANPEWDEGGILYNITKAGGYDPDKLQPPAGNGKPVLDAPRTVFLSKQWNTVTDKKVIEKYGVSGSTYNQYSESKNIGIAIDSRKNKDYRCILKVGYHKLGTGNYPMNSHFLIQSEEWVKPD